MAKNISIQTALTDSREKFQKQLEVQKTQLKDEKNKWQNDKAKVKTLNDISEVYDLDVRGVYMSVCKELLCRDEGSMLEAKFSGRFPIEKNNHGKVFIDRDPKIFR